MNISMKVATHFSYVTHINNLGNIFEMTDSLIIKPKVENKVTRVAAQHCILGSFLFFNKVLCIYQVRTRVSTGDTVTVTDAN